jgi:hypothetical protein
MTMDSFMRAEWYSTSGSANDRNRLDNMPADTVTKQQVDHASWRSHGGRRYRYDG